MRVTIMSAYTWYNKGDAGILIGTIQEINSVLRDDLEINILSFTPEIDYKHYNKIPNVKNLYSNILNPYPFKKDFKGKLWAITKLSISAILNGIMFFSARKLHFRVKKQLKVLHDSDVIIVCGGGFLGGKKFNSLIHLYQIYLATFFKKPVIIWGTSIEPSTNKFLKLITEKVLKRTSFIFPREIVTTNYLQTFLPEDKFQITPDLAFMVPKTNTTKVEEIVKNILPRDKVLIGLTVRNWYFPKSEIKHLALDSFKKTIERTITEISEKLNAAFVFIPQVIFQGDDDRIIAHEIRRNLLNKESFIILENDLSPSEIKELITKFDIFVGTRMHSNIFATGGNVPTVAIAYESKTNGIMHMLDLDDYVVNIEDVTPENLINLIIECYTNKEKISTHLSKRIPEIQRNIREKSQYLERLRS